MTALAISARSPADAPLSFRSCRSTSLPPVADMETMRPAQIKATRDFPCDLHGMRRSFPGQWAGFLQSHFGGNATHIAAFFDVDRHTASAWLHGKHGATAPVALYAINTIPAARRMLLEDGE